MLMRPGRRKLLVSFEQGEAPSDFLYGFAELRNSLSGIVLEEFEYTDLANQCKWLRCLLDGFERMFSSVCLTHLRLAIALLKYSALGNRELVITNIDSIGLGLALIKSILPTRCRQIHISQGLTNELEKGNRRDSLIWELRTTFTRLILGNVDQVIVLGKGAGASLLRHHLVRKDQLKVIQYGVDINFWTPSDCEVNPVAPEEEFILSVGSDAGRDYSTLLKCKLPCQLKIVTRMQLEKKAGVEILSDLSDYELRELYRKAKFVVIPLKDIPQPSGQSATLQAMACGKAVIITDTRGFWDPDQLIDGEHLLLVPQSGCVANLEHRVQWLFDHSGLRTKIEKNATAKVHSTYSMFAFSQHLHQCCKAVNRGLWSMSV